MTSATSTRRHCPSCGVPVFDAHQRFCDSCGALLSSSSTGAAAGAGGSPVGSGVDGAVNQYIQDRMRESTTVIAQQMKQELKAQVRRGAEMQLRRNGGKIALYAGVGIAALIVLSALISLVTGLLMHLLPFALLIVAAYIGYISLRGRPRH